MGPFLDAFPDIKLDVVFDDGFLDLAAEGFDAGVRIGELLERDMVAVRISGPLRFAVLGSPRYLAERGTPERPSDLARHTCIAYRFRSTRAVATWELHDSGREISFTPEPRLSANTMSLVVAAAADGLGLAFAPEALAAAQLRSGAVVKVLERHCPLYEPFHLYHPSHRLTPPKLKAFVSFMRARGRSLLGW
jgi:DNA-binding transcriptional LysR family regulator